MSSENNLISDSRKREFYVWISPDHIAWKRFMLEGRLESIQRMSGEDNLVFVENPKNVGIISPFHANLIQQYRIEISLERFRRSHFSDYLSRLDSLFLFETLDAAIKYYKIHGEHVFNRKLLKLETEGTYRFSRHDVGWIDALLANMYNDKPTFDPIATSYWNGESVKGKEIKTRIGPQRPTSNFEILFDGIVKPPNWTLKGRELDIIDISSYVSKN